MKEIELTENTTFVRVYDNMPDGSGMYGSWVMKAEDIEGLTPLEIQNKFALSNAYKAEKVIDVTKLVTLSCIFLRFSNIHVTMARTRAYKKKLDK